MRNQPREPEWTVVKLLQWTTSYFNSHKIDSPRATAEILLAHVLNSERIDLYLRHDQPLGPEELKPFKALIKRRVEGEPVAYIVGGKEFWSLDLAVNREVLIPRPETECLVETALTLLSAESDEAAGRRILELGTGSGAVILALASQRRGPLYFASDRSWPALQLARANARRHNLAHAVHFFCADWLAPLAAAGHLLAMVVANPPYIPTRDLDGLQIEIRHYEPRLALDGGEDGLASLRQIIGAAWRCLRPQGHLVLEMGYDQQAALQQAIAACGHYDQVAFEKDYSGHDRVVRMRYTG